MEALQQIWQQGKTPIIIVCSITIVYMIGMVVYLKMRKKTKGNQAEQFLQDCPNAAKVYLTEKKNTSVAQVKVHSVDGQKLVKFPEVTRPGFYLKPGQHTCEMSYEYSEYVSRKKTIVHSTGKVKKVLEVEPNKAYLLVYNNEENKFEFREYLD